MKLPGLTCKKTLVRLYAAKTENIYRESQRLRYADLEGVLQETPIIVMAPRGYIFNLKNPLIHWQQ